MSVVCSLKKKKYFVFKVFNFFFVFGDPTFFKTCNVVMDFTGHEKLYFPLFL